MAARPRKRPVKKVKAHASRTVSRATARGSRRKATQLDLRRTPLQARGQATFERILDATARLLDEVGTEGISTNLIAKAAGVNVATLYQYFPNKQAVLLALFQRQSDQRIDVGESMVEGLGGRRDWRRVLGEAIDAIADLRRSEPGATALRQAMRSSPDLLAHDVQGNLHAARRLADALVDAGAATPEEAKLVARCTMEVLTSLLDMWAVESGGRDNRIVEQVKVMLESYLAPYLETATRRGALRRRA
jgi:AcrR family transcriptional regulator